MFTCVLSACLRQETPVEKIYTVLEKVASIETGFEEVQDPLVKVEKKEKETYDKITGLGVQQYDERVALSNDAQTMVSERKRYMEKETKSLQESEKKFKKIAALKVEIDDKQLKKQANELYVLMINRYKAHDVLTKEYLNGTTYDQQLYEMFKDKNVSIDKLGAQVEKVNTTYKKIYAANDHFNKLTEKYNDKKLLFYKKAGLVKK